ncbi:hypothetical protein KCU90_g18, partial [Aureobasidium melanogenum]
MCTEVWRLRARRIIKHLKSRIHNDDIADLFLQSFLSLAESLHLIGTPQIDLVCCRILGRLLALEIAQLVFWVGQSDIGDNLGAASFESFQYFAIQAFVQRAMCSGFLFLDKPHGYNGLLRFVLFLRISAQNFFLRKHCYTRREIIEVGPEYGIGCLTKVFAVCEVQLGGIIMAGPSWLCKTGVAIGRVEKVGLEIDMRRLLWYRAPGERPMYLVMVVEELLHSLTDDMGMYANTLAVAMEDLTIDVTSHFVVVAVPLRLCGGHSACTVAPLLEHPQSLAAKGVVGTPDSEVHSHSPTSPLLQVFPKRTTREQQVLQQIFANDLIEPSFAGRIGGNQEFVANDQQTIQHQPDAAPIVSIKAALRLNGFANFEIWRMAFIEGYATSLLVIVTGAGASALSTIPDRPMATTLFGALLNLITLTLFVFTAAPGSGGHLNPTITMATFFAGLCTLPRALLYIVAQSVGGIVGAYFLRLGLGNAYFPEASVGVIPGCTVNPELVTKGQLFVLEYLFAQGLIFTAFGVGLDPRQGKVFGPAFSPVLVGFTLALGTLASSFVKPGYTGASLNSARCLGLMVAKGEMQYHYLHWLGTFAAAVLHGMVYYFAPPYMRDTPLSFFGSFRRRRTFKAHQLIFQVGKIGIPMVPARPIWLLPSDDPAETHYNMESGPTGRPKTLLTLLHIMTECPSSFEPAANRTWISYKDPCMADIHDQVIVWQPSAVSEVVKSF